MKAIGLVSATLNNYGSLLQTYALQRKVSECGCYTEIVKYREPVSSKIRRLQYGEYLKVCLNKIFLRKVAGLRHHHLNKMLQSRASAFERFRCQNLLFSKPCFNRNQLEALAADYQMVVLGSDQLWQPMNLLMDFFTLTFVPDRVRKVAYAASFGVSEIPQRMKPAYKAYLERFDKISCRESAGAEIVRNLIGREVPVVCDPTLLMTAGEWLPLLSDKATPNDDYIFCYFLGNNPQQRMFVMQLKERTGCSIVALPHIVEYVSSDEKFADCLLYDAGPAEFLHLINNAKYVCTDSFHATVFSLQFHRQFFVFDRFENSKGHSTTSRIETLLGVVGREDRLIRNTLEALASFPALCDIDYLDIDKKLETFRQFSHNFLKEILDNVKNGKENC